MKKLRLHKMKELPNLRQRVRNGASFDVRLSPAPARSGSYSALPPLCLASV